MTTAPAGPSGRPSKASALFRLVLGLSMGIVVPAVAYLSCQG